MSGSRLRRALLAPLVLVLTLPAGAADAAVPVTTSVADVRGVTSPSGSKTMVTYEVTHDVAGRVEPFTALPGARVPRSAAFDGMWADSGFMGSWLAPTGSFRFQFSPQSELVEDAYFTDFTVRDPEAAPMDAGDRFELAMGQVAWNTPMPTDRPRGDTTGTLDWDATVDIREVEATHGDDSGTMDSLFIRADVVARGGDVDARSEAVRMPSLVIDLPRTYPQQVQGMYQLNAQYPSTHYVSSMSMRVVPAIGKAIIDASIRGYIHEAREYRLAGGADIAEWHIPLNAMVVLSSQDDLVPRGIVDLPAGGEALVGEIGGAAERFDLAPGGTLTLGPGMVPVRSDPGADAIPAPAPIELAAYEQANLIDRRLDRPVELSTADGSMVATVDPAFRGQPVLALRGARRHTGATFAEAVSVPYLVVDGEPVRLDRDRLVGLRVLPSFGFFGVQSTGSGGSGALHKVRTHLGYAVKPGLDVEAVYDLGQDRYAFVRMLGVPDGSPMLVQTEVRVLSLGLTPLQARPVYHYQLPPGDVARDGEVLEHEVAIDLDSLAGADDPAASPLAVGARTFSGTALASGIRGRLTVLRGAAPLDPDPVPDPGRSLAGAPVSLVYELPASHPAGWNRRSISVVELADPPTATPDPTPIGTACGTPQVTDVADPDAPPGLDVVRGWLDADAANLYATIELREAPKKPPTGALRYGFDWRFGHGAQRAVAALGSDGVWRFEVAAVNSGYFKLGDVDGEVSGNLIRIAVPKWRVGLRDGQLLRDTGAHTWLDLTAASRLVDSAPQGAVPAYGSGGEYTVGRCT